MKYYRRPWQRRRVSEIEVRGIDGLMVNKRFIPAEDQAASASTGRENGATVLARYITQFTERVPARGIVSGAVVSIPERRRAADLGALRGSRLTGRSTSEIRVVVAASNSRATPRVVRGCI